MKQIEATKQTEVMDPLVDPLTNALANLLADHLLVLQAIG
jgi:hypothetical protein